ncbi:prepilin [Escherichia coli]|nr:prepilin [Escherichia coli]
MRYSGFSLIEVSLATVLLSAATLFMWQTSKTESEIYLSREYSTAVCQYLNAFDSYLSADTTTKAQKEIQLSELSSYLPEGADKSIFSDKMKFYSTARGAGLFVLVNGDENDKWNDSKIFLGFRTAKKEGESVYSYSKYSKIDMNELPSIPEENNIKTMAVIPTTSGHIKDCFVDIPGDIYD